MAAIYMWFKEELQVWTTTLYPVEVIDGLQIGFDISTASMVLHSEESHQNSGTLLGITKPIILITDNGSDEYHQNSGTLFGITKPIILITGDGPDEYHRNSGTLLGITKPLKLVTIDTPDEGLQADFDVYPANCSMTLI